VTSQTSYDLAKWPKAGKNIVVKVQLPIIGDTVRIYDRQRRFDIETDMNAQYEIETRGDLRSFHTATLVPDPRHVGKYLIKLRAKISDQNW
jgi:hypothetical protein